MAKRYRGSVCTLYTASGAVYGSDKQRKELDKAIQKAKEAKIGMWVQSKGNYEAPGEYKKRNLHA